MLSEKNYHRTSLPNFQINPLNLPARPKTVYDTLSVKVMVNLFENINASDKSCDFKSDISLQKNISFISEISMEDNVIQDSNLETMDHGSTDIKSNFVRKRISSYNEIVKAEEAQMTPILSRKDSKKERETVFRNNSYKSATRNLAYVSATISKFEPDVKGNKNSIHSRTQEYPKEIKKTSYSKQISLDSSAKIKDKNKNDISKAKFNLRIDPRATSYYERQFEDNISPELQHSSYNSQAERVVCKLINDDKFRNRTTIRKIKSREKLNEKFYVQNDNKISKQEDKNTEKLTAGKLKQELGVYKVTKKGTEKPEIPIKLPSLQRKVYRTVLPQQKIKYASNDKQSTICKEDNNISKSFHETQLYEKHDKNNVKRDGDKLNLCKKRERTVLELNLIPVINENNKPEYTTVQDDKIVNELKNQEKQRLYKKKHEQPKRDSNMVLKTHRITNTDKNVIFNSNVNTKYDETEYNKHNIIELDVTENPIYIQVFKNDMENKEIYNKGVNEETLNPLTIILHPPEEKDTSKDSAYYSGGNVLDNFENQNSDYEDLGNYDQKEALELKSVPSKISDDEQDISEERVDLTQIETNLKRISCQIFDKKLEIKSNNDISRTLSDSRDENMRPKSFLRSSSSPNDLYKRQAIYENMIMSPELNIAEPNYEEFGLENKNCQSFDNVLYYIKEKEGQLFIPDIPSPDIGNYKLVEAYNPMLKMERNTFDKYLEERNIYYCDSEEYSSLDSNEEVSTDINDAARKRSIRYSKIIDDGVYSLVFFDGQNNPVIKTESIAEIDKINYKNPDKYEEPVKRIKRHVYEECEFLGEGNNKAENNQEGNNTGENNIEENNKEGNKEENNTEENKEEEKTVQCSEVLSDEKISSTDTNIELTNKESPEIYVDIFKINSIISELINTEKTYITSYLRRVVEDYIPEMRNPSLPTALLGQHRVIFGNIIDIYKQHKETFYPSLKDCKDINDVAYCFLKYEDIFTLYPIYSRNKPHSDQLMQKYLHFFAKKQLLLKDALDLASYLLVPIQRIGRYILLLKNLLKYCTTQDSKTSVRRAIEMLEREMQRGNDLIALDSIKGENMNLKNQELLLRDTFTIWTTSRKNSFQAMVFLFTQAILITRIENKSGMEQLFVHDSIRMIDLGYTYVQYDPLEFKIWFRKHDQKVYTLRTKKEEIKMKWAKAIQTELWKQLMESKRKIKPNHETIHCDKKTVTTSLDRPQSQNIKEKKKSRTGSVNSLNTMQHNTTNWYTSIIRH